MQYFKKVSTLLIIPLTLTISTLSTPDSQANECTSRNASGHCISFTKNKPAERTQRVGKSSSTNQAKNVDIDSTSTVSAEEILQKWHEEHPPQLDGAKQPYHASSAKARKAGDAECYTEGDRRPGHYVIGSLPQGDNANKIPNHVGGRYCVPNDAKTFTSNDPAQPKGPTIEEMLQEIEDQFANTNIQAPVLKQSYNLGTGLSEDNPNVHKGDQINFYVDAPTARWEGDLMIGHVEMESYPTQMTIQYGNGDEGSFYTMGKPVSRARGEESRKTATSYAYQRSGNFHAYATVSYSGRFRVNGGDWHALDVVLTKETVDPLLIRVWWVDVGRVAGDCSYDDTRWGCKNDPTMGKPDNPNPRLRKADIRTGQRWHLNDSGDGDTEYSLHRDWPDM